MSKGAIIFIVLGVVIIAFPQIIAYAFGGILVAIGVFIFLGSRKPQAGNSQNDYFKFGDYKIYKNK